MGQKKSKTSLSLPNKKSVVSKNGSSLFNKKSAEAKIPSPLLNKEPEKPEYLLSLVDVLPPEILTKITDQLDGLSFFYLSQTCKSFNEITDIRSKKMVFENATIDQTFIKNFCEGFLKTQFLKLKDCIIEDLDFGQFPDFLTHVCIIYTKYFPKENKKITLASQFKSFVYIDSTVNYEYVPCESRIIDTRSCDSLEYSKLYNPKRSYEFKFLHPRVPCLKALICSDSSTSIVCNWKKGDSLVDWTSNIEQLELNSLGLCQCIPPFVRGFDELQVNLDPLTNLHTLKIEENLDLFTVEMVSTNKKEINLVLNKLDDNKRRQVKMILDFKSQDGYVIPSIFHKTHDSIKSQ